MPVPLVFNRALASGPGLRSMMWRRGDWPWSSKNSGAVGFSADVGVGVSAQAAAAIAPAAASGSHRLIVLLLNRPAADDGGSRQPLGWHGRLPRHSQAHVVPPPHLFGCLALRRVTALVNGA